jgi:hypothetical protein
MSNSNVRTFAIISGFVMVVFYMLVGLLFMFSNAFIQMVPKYRTAIGFFMFLYGLFRLWGNYKMYKASKKENKNE